jgi:hypothetical protein
MVSQPVDDRLVVWRRFPECPDCGGRDWHFGPRGGAAFNLCCLGCWAWFNAVIVTGGAMIQRIRVPRP